MYAEGLAMASDVHLNESSDEMPSPDKINKSYYNQDRKDREQEKMFIATTPTGETGEDQQLLTDILDIEEEKNEEENKKYNDLELEAFPQTKKTSQCTGTDVP